MTPLMYLQLALPVAADKIVADTISKKETFVQKFEKLADMPTDQMIHVLVHWVFTVAFKILAAVAIYMIGRWLIRWILGFFRRLMERRQVDVSLSKFSISLIKAILMIFLIAIIIGVLGLDTTSFVALFASAGLAFGMAMSGTLQNFAGGVMILVLKPFKVGDFVEAQGQTGTVQEIMLFNTLIHTPDNKAILIPNGGISTGIINNYSRESQRRIDWVIGISYGDDYQKARETIIKVLNEDVRIHKDPKPFVALSNLGASSVDIVVRVWVDTPNYWDVYYSVNEKIYKELPENDIRFPFPQMDVHIQK